MTWADGRKYIGIILYLIRGVIRIIKRMVMVNSIGLMVEFIKDNGKMDYSMEKGLILIKMVNKHQENGLKDNEDDLNIIIT